MSVFEEKYLNEDEDERAFCFLASPSVPSISLILQDKLPNEISFASSSTDKIVWTFQNSSVWTLEGFRINIRRVSPSTLDCAWQSLSRNTTAYKMKRAGIQIGGQKQPFCYFDITLIGANGFPIFGGQFTEFSAIHAKCTNPNDLSIWQRLTSVNSLVDLSKVTGLNISFNSASKCCRC